MPLRRLWQALAAAGLAGFSTAPLYAAAVARAAPQSSYHFDASLFRAGAISAQALARFNQPDAVQPGEYTLDVYVNKRFVAREDIRFAPEPSYPDAASAPVIPCISREQWLRFGVAKESLAADMIAVCPFPGIQSTVSPGPSSPPERERLDVDTLSPNPSPAGRERGVCGSGVTCSPRPLAGEGPGERVPTPQLWQLDIPRLRLDFTLPQSLLVRTPRGAVKPELLDAGATMAFFNYSGNAHYVQWRGTEAWQQRRSQRSAYVGINGGLNLGGWQFRQQGSVAAAQGQKPVWTSLRSTVQRPLPAMESQLTLGQTSTGGRFFSALNYTGVALSTDPRMQPDSRRGYAPTVRGVARGNAQVSIRQNGQEIYQTSVPAGPFVIDDLYPTAYNGDLAVEIREADGTVQRFDVPFAAVPESLRPGTWRYQFALGHTRNHRHTNANATFADFTYERGVSNSISVNGGMRAAERYLALAAGGVYTSTLGAFGANLTYTRVEEPGARSNGWLAGLVYSRHFAPTGTQVSLAGYRHATHGYRELTDLLALRNARHRGEAASVGRVGAQAKTRFEASISQPLGAAGRYGSVYVSGSTQLYRGGQHAEHQWQAGYSHAWGNGVSLNLSLSRQKGADGSPDQNVMLSLAVPLGSRFHASSSVSHDRASGSQQQLGISGTLDDAHTVSASLGISRDARSRRSTWNASVNKRLPVANVAANAAGGRQYWQAAANVQGALVLHAGGLTFGPYLSDTFALVHAPGAHGATLANAQGARIDASGYALVPALTPYRSNSILLDPQGSSSDVELEDGAQRVAPLAGASVKVVFRTRSGQPLLIHAIDRHGQPLPLGADALDAEGRVVGMVGQHGLLYVRVAEPHGVLTLVWGDAADQRCRLVYGRPTAAKPHASHAAPGALVRLDAVCHSQADPRFQTQIRTHTNPAPHS